MCLFLDVSLNTSTWTFFFVASSLGAIILGLYSQFDSVTHMLQDEKCRSENVQSLEVTMKQLKMDVSTLKEDIKKSVKEARNIQSEVKLLKMDKTGLVDFAHKGEVISTRNTETYELDGAATFGFRICAQPHLERRILEKSVMPGDCWPISGQEGAAVIALNNDIQVTRVSLEHVHRELLTNKTVFATPKEFSLWGLKDETDHEGETAHFFGRFEYTLYGPEVQTFFVLHPANDTFRIVELKVHTNHGHPEFTCIYRVRIHGQLS